MHKLQLYIFLLFLTPISVFAQEKMVLSSLDSTKIKIGSQANLTLQTTVNSGARVIFPNDKTFGRLEVIESYPIDTIMNGDRYELVKKYGLTQFDSGRYVIPPLTVTVNDNEYRTDSFTLEVADVVVDTTKQKMYDIKPVASLEFDSNFWWYLFVLVCFILIGIGIYWDIKRRKTKEKPEINVSPIERATGNLKVLDHKQLLQKGETKEYYSELTGILRLYIEETVGIPAMESTTNGLLQSLRKAAPAKRMTLPAEVYQDLEKVLKNADMVKFALSQPPQQQVTGDRATTGQLINTLESSIPAPTEEETQQSEAFEEEQLKKKKRRKRNFAIASVFALVIAGLAYFGFMKVYGSLQENVIGYPTEELWKGEWVKSEYGNPAITINTPKVLTRITDYPSQIPKEAFANIDEMQLFTYGTPFGKILIQAGTVRYKPGIQVNVEGAFQGTLAGWEASGARNITINTEQFLGEDDKQGTRVFGSLSVPGLVRDKTTRYYYQVLYFQQLGGLQQVIIMHEDQDEYGIKIADKIIKSIRFKEVQ